MPDSHPAPDSRTRILDAAMTLFARQGYTATSIKQIGAAAERNTALIHYYFASKERLYKAVLQHALSHLQGEVGTALQGVTDPVAGVRALVQAQLALHRAHPDVLHLMVRELTDWGATHAEDAIHTLGATIFARVRGLIETGQHTGHFRADADPRFTAISLVAQMNWLILARPAVGVFLGRGLGKARDADLDAFATHAADLILAGLRPDRPPRPARRAPSRRRLTRSRA